MVQEISRHDRLRRRRTHQNILAARTAQDLPSPKATDLQAAHFSSLLVAAEAVAFARMNIFLAILVYLVMAAILTVGVVLAVKGSFWLFVLGLIGFVLAVTKIAILHH
jgi:hypothetical protein